MTSVCGQHERVHLVGVERIVVGKYQLCMAGQFPVRCHRHAHLSFTTLFHPAGFLESDPHGIVVLGFESDLSVRRFLDHEPAKSRVFVDEFVRAGAPPGPQRVGRIDRGGQQLRGKFERSLGIEEVERETVRFDEQPPGGCSVANAPAGFGKQLRSRPCESQVD